MSSACHAWKLRARTSVVTVASTLPAPRLGWKRGTSHACESLCGAASEGTAPCQTAALSQTCCFRVLSSTSTTSGCARERPTLLPRAKARSVARAGARAAALSSFVHQTRRKNSRELLFFLFWRARARSVPHAKRSALSKPVLRELTFTFRMQIFSSAARLRRLPTVSSAHGAVNDTGTSIGTSV